MARDRQKVTGGVGTALASIWAAYAHFTTAAQLPADAGEMAKMMADPPVYLPWLALAGFVVLLAWAIFWPSKPEEESETLGQSARTSGDGSPAMNAARDIYYYPPVPPPPGPAWPREPRIIPLNQETADRMRANPIQELQAEARAIVSELDGRLGLARDVHNGGDVRRLRGWLEKIDTQRVPFARLSASWSLPTVALDNYAQAKRALEELDRIIDHHMSKDSPEKAVRAFVDRATKARTLLSKLLGSLE